MTDIKNKNKQNKNRQGNGTRAAGTKSAGTNKTQPHRKATGSQGKNSRARSIAGKSANVQGRNSKSAVKKGPKIVQNTQAQNMGAQNAQAQHNSTSSAKGTQGSKHSGGNGGGNHSNVVPYTRPVKISTARLILLFIFIYILYSVVRYATAKHVVGYAVRAGSISENSIYEGLALRTEEVVNSEFAGHINYYSKESTRLAAGKLAYTIDETGEISNTISEETSTGNLFTSEDYADIQTDIETFTETFKASTFSSVYSFKESLNTSIQKVTNNSILTDLESIGESASIHYCTTPNTGYIVYATDRYEDKTFETITASDFDSTNYTQTEIANNSMVSVGDPAYRLEESEDWSIVIRLDSAEAAQELSDLGVVKVRFLKNQYESWATITTRSDSDGNWYANLAFTNSMITFCTDRFIDVELLTETTNGLKIPKTALVDDEFFIVPADYVTEGSSGQDSVLREIYDENGEKSTETVTVTVYNEEDGNVWLDQDALRSGDTLVRLDSNATTTVAQTGQLTGVYNINEGYADFRQVTILAENEEYAIVEADSMYGLREYDYIVLDATTMTPNEFLYE